MTRNYQYLYAKFWGKKLRETSEDRKISHAHWLLGLTQWKWPSYQKQFTDSMYFTLNFQHNTSQALKEHSQLLVEKQIKTRIAKTILYSKRTTGGITIADFNFLIDIFFLLYNEVFIQHGQPWRVSLFMSLCIIRKVNRVCEPWIRSRRSI